MKKLKIIVTTFLMATLFTAGCKDKATEDLILSETETETDECVKFQKEAGVDIAFVMDSSGSMQKNDPGDLRIEKAKVIVKEMMPEDRALVISFDKEANFMTNELTDDHETIISALNEIPSDKKYTDLAAGLDLAINEFEKVGNMNQKIIIALIKGFYRIDCCYFDQTLHRC